MSTPAEQVEAIRHAVEVAKRRQYVLSTKDRLTRSEQFELDMVNDCIDRGTRLLGLQAQHDSRKDGENGPV